MPSIRVPSRAAARRSSGVGAVVAVRPSPWPAAGRSAGVTSVPAVDPGVDRARRPGSRTAVSSPALGRKPSGGVLGVEPGLDGVARTGSASGVGQASASPAGDGAPSTRPGRRRCTSSVTPCSTWSRVFTSRKWSSPVVGVDEELDGARRAVPHRRGQRAGRPRRASPRSRRARSGAGVSSTTFWLRRCSEQSRSPSTTTAPRRRRTPAPRRGGRRAGTARGTRRPTPKLRRAEAPDARRTRRPGRRARRRRACRCRRRRRSP